MIAFCDSPKLQNQTWLNHPASEMGPIQSALRRLGIRDLVYGSTGHGGKSAAEVLAKNHSAMLRRILAWQQVVYAETCLPAWLRDSLVKPYWT